MPGCRRTPARPDRHLKRHAELPASGRTEAMVRANCQKVARKLQWLLSTQPAVPVMSQLASSSEEERDSDGLEASCPFANPGCRRATKHIQAQLTDLGKQVDKMRSTLVQFTHLYRELRRGEERRRKRRTRSPPAPSTLGPQTRSGRRSDAPRAFGSLEPASLPIRGPRPHTELSIFIALCCWAGGVMSSFLLTLGCPLSADLLLGEFEGFQLGSEPTARLRNNVTSKLGRIKTFLGYMAKGTAEPEYFLFLNQPARIRAWPALLGRTRMTEPMRQHYLKNQAQFLDYLSETPPASCRLSSMALVLIRREVRALICGKCWHFIVYKVRTKQAKESRLISKASLVRCPQTAGRNIPALLSK